MHNIKNCKNIKNKFDFKRKKDNTLNSLTELIFFKKS